MKKRFNQLIGYLVAGFCILQISANGAQLQLIIRGEKTATHKGITAPLPKKNLPFTAALGLAVAVSDEENESFSEIGKAPIDASFTSESDHSLCINIRIKSQRINALEQHQPPLFILYHCWKSNLS